MNGRMSVDPLSSALESLESNIEVKSEHFFMYTNKRIFKIN